VSAAEPAEERPIEVHVNGEPLALVAGTTVAELVALISPSPRGVAVAVDRDVVPRSRWGTTRLAAGAQIEVVTAAAGG
jgi:sulfur carrier protein